MRFPCAGVLLAASLIACGAQSPQNGSGPTGPIDDPGGPERRTLLIGLDAGDEAMISPLVEQGRLEHLGRFYEEGASGGLRSHKPFLSPILWTSIATGVGPDRHGVLDFVEIDGSGTVAPVGSRSRRAAPFWEVLGAGGVRTGIVGWLATWPATPLRGWLVTDRMTIHALDAGPTDGDAPAGTTYPGDLAAELRPFVVRPEALSRRELIEDFGQRAMEGPPAPGAERDLRGVSATTRTVAGIAEHMLSHRQPELTAVYFEGLDRLLHLFADAAPPPLPGTDPARARRFGGVAEAFLVSIDRIVGRLAEAAGPDAIILVVSDHGWKTGDDRPLRDPRRDGPFAAEWHARSGLILARGPGVRAGRIEDATIYDVAPTLLAIYGMPPSREFRGRVLEEAFVEGFLPARPVPVDSHGPPAEPVAPGPSAAGGTEEALEALRGLGYLGGAGDADAHDRSAANLATALLDEKRYEQAARLYEQFLQTRPDDYDALFNLGYARAKSGDTDAARRAYELAARSRPGSPNPWVSLAELEMDRKNWGKAWENIETARGIEPRDGAIWNRAGVIACELGRFDEGIRAFERAIEIRPGSPSPYLNLSRVLEEAGRKAEAIAVIRRGLETSPNEERLHRRLALLTGSAAG